MQHKILKTIINLENKTNKNPAFLSDSMAQLNVNAEILRSFHLLEEPASSLAK